MKVTAYEVREVSVVFKDDSRNSVQYEATSYDTVEMAGRNWLYIYGPERDFYIDMDLIESFSFGRKSFDDNWRYVVETEPPEVLPEDELVAVVRLDK